MVLIKHIDIISFRSILNMSLDIDNTLNLISICGENNVGKTNTLRAIDLFFNPETYDVAVDRPILKLAQGGARIDPKITVEFYNVQSEEFYEIIRDLKDFKLNNNSGLSGTKYKRNGTRKGRKTILKQKDAEQFLDNIEFRYIESINIDIPQLVEELTTDVIDVEYDKSRITANRKALKEAFTTYTSGLQDILNVFSQNISDTFKGFKDNWNVSFHVPSSVETFRDLISNDVELLIDDKGCQNVEQKGSGLQRLAVILLNFEVIKRIKNKNYIVCIDEPDIYLHEGLQRKLMEFFKDNSDKVQILYTTHSKTFINQYSMKNIFLLGAELYSQYSSRKKKYINVVETKYIDTSSEEGYEKICTHLGIEKNNYDILQKNNLLVEGGCDKKYLEELASYFSIKKPKIISLDGVNNAEKYLNFYNSYYKNNISAFKPQVKILFDNDDAGRDAYSKIKQKKYDYIEVCCLLLKNFDGSSNTHISKNTCNHEIEDFMYPEIMCYLVNKLLTKKTLNKVKLTDVVIKITKPAFKNNGILSLLEYEKNEKNQDKGDTISFVSSSKATNDIKSGLANMFNIAGDRQLISLMDKCKDEYPYVRSYLNELFNF